MHISWLVFLAPPDVGVGEEGVPSSVLQIDTGVDAKFPFVG